MKAIYFPFSYLDEEKAEMLKKYFKEIIVYMPIENNIYNHMKELAKSGNLVLKTFKHKDDDKAEQLIKRYKTWADSHDGIDIASFAHILDKDILYDDEDSMFKIKSDIKKSISDKNKTPDSESDNNLSNVIAMKVFLIMAQELDIYRNEVCRNIKLFEKFNKKIFQEIHGVSEDIEDIITDIFENEDAGIYMTSQRIKSWAYLFSDDFKKYDDLIFITDSPAIFDDIKEKDENYTSHDGADFLLSKEFKDVIKIKSTYEKIFGLEPHDNAEPYDIIAGLF